MSHRRYEIYSPTRHNDGSPAAAAAFMVTQQELVAQFGACSFFPRDFSRNLDPRGANF
jgi:hypothetical protein